MSHSDNYGGIGLSIIMEKIFDHMLLLKQLQSGFKRKHLTAQSCTFAVRETIQYFNSMETVMYIQCTWMPPRLLIGLNT